MTTKKLWEKMTTDEKVEDLKDRLDHLPDVIERFVLQHYHPTKQAVAGQAAQIEIIKRKIGAD